MGSSRHVTYIWSVDFQQMCQENAIRKLKVFFNKIVMEQLNKCMRKINFEPYLMPHKTKFRMNHRPIPKS